MESRRYLVYCRLFGFGSVTHLLLDDALQMSWAIPDAIYWLGLVVVAWRGHVVGWAMCFAGLLWPILWLRDQLTHSFYLAGCALAAVVCWLGSSAGREERITRGLPLVVRVLTVGVYAAAAFHKLNRDFFDPSVSCATAGLDVLAENWGLPWVVPAQHASFWPIAFVLVEIAIAVLFVVRPGVGLLLAIPMHVPLTLVFAPEFAFVMMSGWVMLLEERDLDHLWEVLKHRWRWCVGIALGAEVVSMALYFQDHWVPYPWWFFKEALLYFLFVWLVMAWVGPRPAGVLGWLGAWRERAPRSGRVLAGALGVLWAANVFTPYWGVQFHHAGAMLSNLRIDRGCWNHLIVPESVRVLEPYVRIERASLSGTGHDDDMEAVFLDGLWNPESLDLAREQLCRRGARVELAGTWTDRRFAFDLCSRDWPFGEAVLPRFRRYQWNLHRECPQRCVH